MKNICPDCGEEMNIICITCCPEILLNEPDDNDFDTGIAMNYLNALFNVETSEIIHETK